jgi:hypothetical protein
MSKDSSKDTRLDGSSGGGGGGGGAGMYTD